ncbi:MAG TPA: VIT and VWA domain-containing protein, partial [Planctomycetota bacterium]|nr:VIT and VWA domain-containing protein [Planctomycetota bacterium]
MRTPLLALAAAASAVPAAAQHGPPACHVVVPQFRTFAHAGHHPVVIERVDARVRIVGQTARTTLTIDLHNPGSGQAEAVILLPVPGEAAVSGFAFAGPAPEPTARLLPAEEARATYADIVRRLRDPGLLEFAGARLIRSSVFPIAAHGRSKVRLNYEHVLEADGPRIDYVLLRSEALGRQAPWTIDVDVETRRPIAIVYSPSHAIDTRRVAANRMRVQLAAGHEATPGAFRLSLVTDQGAGPAASLFAYPDPRVGGGYYLLLLGAPPARPGKPVRREVTVVLDRSGSMAGEKLDQARAAALQVIAALDDGEQFNLIDYATTVERFAPRPVVKDDRSLAKVSAYLGALRPLGGTNTHDALLEALRQPTDGVALPIVLFLTDGLPTVGTTAERAIREMVAAGNAARRRVFTFGVGEDVNVPLLDRIAEGTGATSTYVLPGEDVELKVARVFKKLSGPVLAGPAVTARGADGSEDPARLRERIPQ